MTCLIYLNGNNGLGINLVYDLVFTTVLQLLTLSKAMTGTTLNIVFICVEVFISIVTIFGNVIVLVAIVKSRLLHTVTNVFIGSLAMADFLVGICAGPLAGLSHAGYPRNVNGCIFVSSLIVISTNVSILILLGIAVERFIAIKLPFGYHRILTIPKALYINFGSWLLGIVLGMLPMYGWNTAPDNIDSCSFKEVIPTDFMVYLEFYGLFLPPAVAMLGIYSYIFYILMHHSKHSNTSDIMSNDDREMLNQWKREVCAAKALSLLIVAFIIMWLPINIIYCIRFYYPTWNLPVELVLAAVVLSHTNSSINPFLYALSNSQFLRAIKVVFNMESSPETSSSDLDGGINKSVSVGQGPATVPNDINALKRSQTIDDYVKEYYDLDSLY